MGDTQAPATPEDVADSIVVAGFPADSIMAVHQREDPDEQRLQIIKGDVTLVAAIRKGKRIGLDTLENVETDVQAIFKRARRELQTVGEQVLAVGEQIQKKVEGQPDDNIAKAVNCGVDNHLWSTSVV